MKDKKVLIIVPVYNEKDNIDFIIKDLSSIEYDVIFIDDSSTDNSANLIKSKNHKVISLPVNLGIGGCMQTGYIYAVEHDYDIAVQYDGDGQHIAKYINDLVVALNEGYDYVIGSRFAGEIKDGFKSSSMRRIGIKLLSLLIRLISGKWILDATSGFRICNKELIKLFSEYYPIDYPEPEVAGALARQGYKIKEIPVIMRERQNGKSSINLIKSIYYIIKVCFSILTLSHSFKKG